MYRDEGKEEITIEASDEGRDRERVTERVRDIA